MNYKEAISYIKNANQFGTVLGLESIRVLLDQLGNPQSELTFVHIAGTNGKGSTLAYISTVLKEAHKKVGRYISPTVMDYRERIQINGTYITQKAIAYYITEIETAIVHMLEEEGRSRPTIFEIETAMAFLYFRDKKCDIVVLETGLGGLMDATNIIENTLVAVITSVSMDHMSYLGNNLIQITRNKSGIIKKGATVVTLQQDDIVNDIIKERCDALGCPLVTALPKLLKGVKQKKEEQIFSYKELAGISIQLLGEHQLQNCIIAIEVLAVLNQKGFQISQEQLKRGLHTTRWLGRFSVISKSPTFIVDGAHNADAAVKLATSLDLYYPNRSIIFIMGVLKDKEYAKIIQATYKKAEQILTITPPNNARALHAYELAKEVQQYHNSVTALDSLQEAVELSYMLADKDTIIVAFGSLSYLGELITIVENKDRIRRDSHGK